MNVSEQKMKSGVINTNEYWSTHPDHILGEMDFGHGTTRGCAGMIVNRPDNYAKLLERDRRQGSAGHPTPTARRRKRSSPT